jgi:hypothetical protein
MHPTPLPHTSRARANRTMPPSPPPPPSPSPSPLMRMRALSVLGVLACLSACQSPPPIPVGEKRDILAEYSLGQLSATLPAEISIPTLRAAAEHTLRSRGYVITQSSSTADRMRVIATSQVDGRHEPTTITGRVTYSNIRVTVESGAFGDEAASRAILDDVLRRLGR